MDLLCQIIVVRPGEMTQPDQSASYIYLFSYIFITILLLPYYKRTVTTSP